MYQMQFAMKKYFFDRAAVEDRLSKREARAMAKIGSFIRRSARKSLNRKTPASAGKPPATHSSEPSLRTILFAYEPSLHSLVVGPVLLRRSSARSGYLLDGKQSAKGVWIEQIELSTTVPALHEYGGTAQAVIDGEHVTLDYPARPFMGPALEVNRKSHKLIEAWRALL